MLGGLCAIVIEPIVDVMGMCFFPIEGQWVGLETFAGRPVPIWMYPVYSWFVGGQAFLLWRSMQRGTLTGRGLWQHWLVGWGVNIVLETPGVLMGVYAYYGDQAFNFWGLPLWWPAVNATMPVVAAFVVHKAWHLLQGWRVLAIVPLLPMADGLVNGGLAWPTWSALHSEIGYAATYPAAILTIALAALAVWILASALPRIAAVSADHPSPLAGEGRTHAFDGERGRQIPLPRSSSAPPLSLSESGRSRTARP
jgi:hypothetical protein